MIKLTWLFLVVTSLINPANIYANNIPVSKDQVTKPNSESIAQAITGLHLPFIANAGQTAPSVAFYAQTFSGTVYVTQTGELVYALPSKDGKPGWTLVERFEQGRPHPVGTETSPSKVNYIKNQAGKAISQNAKTFGKLDLGEVFAGVKVGLVAHGDNVEKLYTVAPGADVKAIHMQVAGANSLKIDTKGALVVETGHGPVEFSAPIAWQEQQGAKTPVPVSYALDENGYGFKLGKYDHSQQVMIDPLIQATYLGGNGTETAIEIKVNPITGNVYVLGQTQNPGSGFTNNFPGTTGGWQSKHSSNDTYNVFIANFSPDLKSLIQATYLKIFYSESALSSLGKLELNFKFHPQNGDLYLWGLIENGILAEVNGAALYEVTGQDVGFVSRFSADLTLLRQSSYLGNRSLSSTNNPFFHINDMDISPISGDLYFVGDNGANSIDPGSDVVVVQLSSDLKSLYQNKTFGSSRYDTGYGIAIHPNNGDIYIAGETSFSDFPNTQGSYQSVNNAVPATGMTNDGFIAQLSSDLDTIKQSTYLGGAYHDAIMEIAFDANPDNIILGGKTSSTNFPGLENGANSKQTTLGVWAKFFTKMTSDLKTLLQSTIAVYDYPALFETTGKFPRLLIHPVTYELYAIGQYTNGYFGNLSASRFTADLKKSYGTLTLIDESSDHYASAYTLSPISGDLYILGNQGRIGIPNSTSTIFPNTTGGYQVNPATSKGGMNDVFIARYTSDDIGSPKADLGIAISSSANPVIVGSQTTYTVTVTNKGPNPATKVKLTDDLPSGVKFVSASSGCTRSGLTITCSIASLAAGEQVSFNITVTPTAVGAFSNSASVVGTETDPESANNTATQLTTVQAVPILKADLGITISSTPAQTTVGVPLTYTLTVNNNGPDKANQVSVWEYLSNSMNYVSSSAGCSLSSRGPDVICNLDSLAAGAQASFTITATPKTTGSLENTASVKSAETDPQSDNNSATHTVSVSAPGLNKADLEISQTVNAASVQEFGSLLYTLTVKNNGPDNASQVEISDVFPGTVYILSIADGCNNSNNTVTCAVGDLASGASKSYSVSVTPIEDGSLSNTVTASGAETDSTPNNNSATQVVTVTPEPPVLNDEVGQKIYERAFGRGCGACHDVPTHPQLSVLIKSGQLDRAKFEKVIREGQNEMPKAIDAIMQISVVKTAGYNESQAIDALYKHLGGKVGNIPSYNADLEISQTVNVASTQVDDNLLYTLVVKNNGPDSAHSVEITDNFPSTATIDTVPDNCSINDTSVSCLVGEMAVNETKSYTVSVIPTEEGNFINTVSLTSGVTDPVPANNSSTESITVSDPTKPAEPRLAGVDYGVGAIVTITGGGFTDNKGKVIVGNKTAAIISWSDASIVLKLPKLKSGAYPVTVKNKNKLVFNLGQLNVHAPEIGSISVNSGAKKTKNQFSIFGRYFGNSVKPQVYLISSKNKRFALTVLKGFNDGAITIVTPKLKADIYQLRITNNAGNSQLIGFTVN